MPTIATPIRSDTSWMPPGIASRKRFGDRAYNDWGNVGVGFFRESGQRALHTRQLRGPDQLLHPAQSFAGHMEVGHGTGCEPCRDGGAYTAMTGSLGICS